MNHIVAFSGGAASAFVASIVKKQFPNDTILLYHSTTEDSDGRDIRIYMHTIECEICSGQIILPDCYSNGECPRCGLKYRYVEDLVECLTEEQWEILRKELNKNSNNGMNGT